MSANKNMAAIKAARTVRNRKEFINRFGAHTFDAIRKILKSKNSSHLHFDTRSLAAFKANLTRGTYGEFVRVSTTGKVVKNTLNI